MLIAVLTPACASKDQYTHPLDASSEYTNPLSDPTNTRPAATAGCPQAEVPLGNANAHFSVSFGTWALVRPPADWAWRRGWVASGPQPLHIGPRVGSPSGLLAQWFFIADA